MKWFLSEPSLELANPDGLELKAAPPRFEHGFEAPQASVISKLHYRAVLRHRTPQYKREGEPLAGCTRVHGRCAHGAIMVLRAERSVEFSMVDLANIAYYPRIFDLAHRFFESVWDDVCGQSYPHLINERRVGFPVVSVEASFLAPLRYGDVITAHITFSNIGTSSLGWRYRFVNQAGEEVWTSSQTTVCVNMDTMEPMPIPDALRRGLEPHMEAEP